MLVLTISKFVAIFICNTSLSKMQVKQWLEDFVTNLLFTTHIYVRICGRVLLYVDVIKFKKALNNKAILEWDCHFNVDFKSFSLKQFLILVNNKYVSFIYFFFNRHPFRVTKTFHYTLLYTFSTLFYQI